MISKIINKKEQENLTPEAVLQDLLEGNKRFVDNAQLKRDLSAQKKDATSGQYPKAIVLSCVDSRVPLETVTDQGIGDIFVARVAGNIENEDILGSMEYACKVAGSKLIVVLGHEKCGAVSAACDDVKLGNITTLLEKIKPAIHATQDIEGERNSSNADFVERVVEKNVQLTVERIREKSTILKDMEDTGEIKIVGGVYSLNSGTINLI
ncbi:carbonic anhydrase family protein [Psychroflexus planctonicus]|uniref:Carbonic anhydrase n=1 Tax=Psychroflexus planctonicus TaxID=1526575 RepID=A0ABQ1SEU3_9FLAO|nr:carbonic anhydrase family protein [Psychroflexus planctonicus]GGE34059.1 carbonic anhydrase [Psychroflexus planctonicus]